MRNISSEKAKGEFRKIKDPGSIPSGQKADRSVGDAVRLRKPTPEQVLFCHSMSHGQDK